MDLDIVRVIKSVPKKHEPDVLTPLTTPWGEQLLENEDAIPLRMHPRPQFARNRVKVLNGWWEYAIVECEDADKRWRGADIPQTMDGKIRVPFSPETVLSGVGRQLQPNELLWYRYDLSTLPPFAGGDRCRLHFDGVDHACAVYVDGQLLGVHEGAYQPFSFYVTRELRAGAKWLEVCVYDPSDTGTQLRGKQRLERGGMWYTAQSGIWQSVWVEVMPHVHVDEVALTPDADAGVLNMTAWLSGTDELGVGVFDAEGNQVAESTVHPADGVGVVTLAIPVENPHLWSPEDPYLYNLRITYGEDWVRSYCAFRTVGIEKDEQGVARFCLNHKPYFLRGLLDQGYWPDGLMTAPSEEAMEFDLEVARKHGFNMLRKHIKTEPERWYWLCDKMGMLVWQDMPSGGDIPSDHYSRDLPTLYRRSWHSLRDHDSRDRARLGSSDERYRRAWTENMSNTISRLSNHPCVVTWVLFNESWGQFDAALATQLAWELDRTRPVLSASGWYDQGCGDYHGVHNYFRGLHMFADPYAGKKGSHGTRAQVVSEFGGLTWRVDGHSSLERTYGYAEFATKDEWRSALDDMLATMDLLEDEGLSGYVYTQVSDVEEETNGLVTYDRKVDKLA